MNTPAPGHGQEPIDTSDFTPEEKAELAAIESGSKSVNPPAGEAEKEPREFGLSVLIACIVGCLVVGGGIGWGIASATVNPKACHTAVEQMKKMEDASELADDDGMDMKDALEAVDQYDKYEKLRDKCLGD